MGQGSSTQQQEQITTTTPESTTTTTSSSSSLTQPPPVAAQTVTSATAVTPQGEVVTETTETKIIPKVPLDDSRTIRAINVVEVSGSGWFRGILIALIVLGLIALIAFLLFV